MGQLLRVIPVMLPLVSRLLRNERRRDDVTVVAPLLERPLQHVASPTRFVARVDLAGVSEAREIATEHFQIVGHFVDAARCLGTLGEDGNHDGLLVHIEADVQTALRNVPDRSRHWAGPLGDVTQARECRPLTYRSGTLWFAPGC